MDKANFEKGFRFWFDKEKRLEYAFYNRYEYCELLEMEDGFEVPLEIEFGPITKEMLDNEKDYAFVNTDPLVPLEFSIGSLLLYFVNANFETIQGFTIFINRYGFSSLIKMSGRSDIQLDKIVDFGYKYQTKNFRKFLAETFEMLKDDLIMMQNNFKKMIEHCYTNNEKLLPIEKFHNNMPAYYFGKNIELDFTDIQTNLTYYDYEEDMEKVSDENRQKNILPYSYAFKSYDIASICYLSFRELLTIPDIRIVKCKNCSKYFIPKHNHETIYCDNIFTNGKTCKQIGSNTTYKENLNQDKALKLYRQIYSRKASLASKYKDKPYYKDEYELFKKKSKIKKEQYLNGKLQQQSFINWLKRQENAI